MGRRTQWGVTHAHAHTRTHTDRQRHWHRHSDLGCCQDKSQSQRSKRKRERKKESKKKSNKYPAGRNHWALSSNNTSRSLCLLSGKTLEPKSNWDLWAQRCVSRSARRVLLLLLLLLQLFASIFHVVFHDYSSTPAAPAICFTPALHSVTRKCENYRNFHWISIC